MEVIFNKGNNSLPGSSVRVSRPLFPSLLRGVKWIIYGQHVGLFHRGGDNSPRCSAGTKRSRLGALMDGERIRNDGSAATRDQRGNGAKTRLLSARMDPSIPP